MARACRLAHAWTSGGGPNSHPDFSTRQPAGRWRLKVSACGRARGSLRVLDSPRQLDARRDVHLAEDVAQVRLYRLWAEEELGGDLRIGLSIDDEQHHLELALRQRLDSAP